MGKIEEKLEQVHQFIKRYQAENGFPPSVREICSALSIKSTATAHDYLDKLKERGIWFYAADMDGESVYETDLKGAIGIILGGEGDGVSRLVKEKSDFVISVPMYGKVNSMNVSCAAAVILAQAANQKRKGGITNG